MCLAKHQLNLNEDDHEDKPTRKRVWKAGTIWHKISNPLMSVWLCEYDLGDILEILVIVKDVGDVQNPYEKEASHAIGSQTDMVEPFFSRKFAGFKSIVLISNTSEVRKVEYGKIWREFDVMEY